VGKVPFPAVVSSCIDCITTLLKIFIHSSIKDYNMLRRLGSLGRSVDFNDGTKGSILFATQRTSRPTSLLNGTTLAFLSRSFFTTDSYSQKKSDEQQQQQQHHRADKPLTPPSSTKPVFYSKSTSHAKHHPHSHQHQHHQHGGVHGAQHQLSHRAKEKIGMKVAEKFVSKGVPRLLKINKVLGLRLVVRKLARGVAIALPAIGGIFAAFVTISDSKRALAEREQGHKLAFGAFSLAAIFDAVDLGAHVVTALSLADVLDHHIAHTSEEGL
jgi:hypothetical protein